MVEQLKKQVIEQSEAIKHPSDEQLMDIIDEVIIRNSRQYHIPLSIRNKYALQIFNSLRRLDILQELMEDPDITEIMVNGAAHIFYEKSGKNHRWKKAFINDERVEDLIQQIVASVNRVVNRSDPICDARLPDGSRVHVVLPPIALNGPVLTIRKFSSQTISMEQLVEWKAVSTEASVFLRNAVKMRKNIFISAEPVREKPLF